MLLGYTLSPTHAATGHGGNKELQDLLKAAGPDHARFFKLTLFEVCDIQLKRGQIMQIMHGDPLENSTQVAGIWT
jgi:hypothetical protein